MLTVHLENVDIKKLEEDISRASASPEGQATIQRAIREATELVEKFREARYVDQKKLYEQVTL